VATKGVLRHLHPLGDSPCRSLADSGARVNPAEEHCCRHSTAPRKRKPFSLHLLFSFPLLHIN
jgi:hypothetical protein